MADFAIDAVHRTWLNDAATPLAVDRATVEPIWIGLSARAKSLGFVERKEAVTFTQQPDLRLLLEDGRELAGCANDMSHYTFRISNGDKPVRLLSRAARPSTAIGPFVDDRRMLGVAVEKLVLWNELEGVHIPAAGIALAGWHEAEGSCRWTNGNAALDLPVFEIEIFLEVHLGATMSYVVEDRAKPAMAA